MATLNSRIWSNRGTKPAKGDEVYSQGKQPIANYDNWSNWSITKDLHNINDELGEFKNNVLTTDETSVDTDALESNTIDLNTGKYLTGGKAVSLGGQINISGNKSALDDDFVNEDGDTMTGPLTLKDALDASDASVKIEKRTSEPSNPAGRIWQRTDL